MAILRTGVCVGLESLQDLHLGSNKIHTIEEGAFTELGSLMKIDLSENDLKVLDSKVFANVNRPFTTTRYQTSDCIPVTCDQNICWLLWENVMATIKLRIHSQVDPTCGGCVSQTPTIFVAPGSEVSFGEILFSLHFHQKATNSTEGILSVLLLAGCVEPGGIPHGRRPGPLGWYDAETQVSCTCTGSHTGGGTVTCLHDGTWTDKPKCEGTECVTDKTCISSARGTT